MAEHPDLLIVDLDDTLSLTSLALESARQDICAHVFGELHAHERNICAEAWRWAGWTHGDTDIMGHLAVVALAIKRPLPVVADRVCMMEMYLKLELSYLKRNQPVIDAVTDERRRSGIEVACVSNGSRLHQSQKYEELELGELIPRDRFYVCDGVDLPLKPATVAYERAIHERPVRSVVVAGDRLTDILPGKLLGAFTVRVSCDESVVPQLRGQPPRELDADIVTDAVGFASAISRALNRRTEVQEGRGS